VRRIKGAIFINKHTFVLDKQSYFHYPFAFNH